jgi:hypothetical protein
LQNNTNGKNNNNLQKRKKSTSTTGTQIGGMQALVCGDNQLMDDLLVIHSFLDAGYDILFSAAGRLMEDPKTGDHILIFCDDRKWLIDLKDIMSIEPNLLKRKSLYCLSNSVLNKVLSLHERMGHPALKRCAKQ